MADKRANRITELIKPLRVKPGSKVNLAEDFDPGYKAGYVKKKDASRIMKNGIAMLSDYQARLAAQDRYGCSCACRRWTPAVKTARSATS